MEIILKPITDSIAFEIFGFPIRWYGIVLMLAMLAGYFVGITFFKKKFPKLNDDIFTDSIYFPVILGIIGARLFYVIGDFEFYINNTSEILKIYHGGLSIYGGILGGILGLFIYCKKANVSFCSMLDIYAILMPLSQSIGRWGNYFNQEAYGRPTNGLLKLYVDKNFRYEEFANIDYYHPTFLYESILDLISFIILIFIFNKFKKIKNGEICLIYLAMYAIIRLIVENYRIDSIMSLYSIPIAKILSIFVIIITIPIAIKIALKK